ncbi:MAG TPA: hypothetical protein VL135_02260 [Terracidiphilus sp.]|nr:hypothetical protein [Terracidiphilus sp.]
MSAGMERVGSKKRSKKSQRAISAKLKTAAEFLLRHEGKLVIDSLAENCRDGHVQSTRLLYELTQSDPAVEDDFRSLAFGLDEE